MAVVVSMTQVIPEHQEILRAGSRLMAYTTDVSQYAVKGSNTINFPTMAKQTIETKAIDGDFTIGAPSYGDDSLTLDQKIGAAFSLNIHQEKQNRLNALIDLSKNILNGMGEDVDKKLYIALRKATNASSRVVTAKAGVYGTSDNGDILADFVALNQKLDADFVPSSGRVLAPRPADYARLILSKLFQPYEAGDVLKTGVVGTFLGCKVVQPIISLADQSDTAQHTLMFHPSGIVRAVQGDTLMSSAPKVGSSVVEYEISDLFGCKVLKQTGSAGSEASPYVARLSDFVAPTAP